MTQGIPKGYVEIDIDGQVIGANGEVVETDMAKLIDFGEHEVWIPESQIYELFEDSIIISEWLAKEKGLI